MKLIAPIFIALLLFSSCSITEEPYYSVGQSIILNDGRRVVIEQQLPAGYLVYVPNKMEIVFFQININNIKR